MKHAARTTAATLIIAIASVAGSLPPSAVAQAPRSSQNALGVPAAQWLRLGAPQLRQLTGFPAAAPRILAQAEQGDPYAMALISSAYATGTGVPKNPSEALRWAQRSADTGLPFGIYVLAQDYFYGTGTPVNYPRYLELLKKAADAGSIIAASDYAGALFAGQLTQRNYLAAKPYAKMSAEGGDAKGKMLYGTLLFDRSLSGHDPVAAAEWIRASARDGFDFAKKAARALDLQDEFAKSAGKLFVSSFGNALVGASTVSARPNDPCVTRITVNQAGKFGVFMVNWQETSVASAGDSFLNLTGRILMGTDTVGGDIRSNLGLTLHRDQMNDPAARDQMFDLGLTAKALASACQAMG